MSNQASWRDFLQLRMSSSLLDPFLVQNWHFCGSLSSISDVPLICSQSACVSGRLERFPPTAELSSSNGARLLVLALLKPPPPPIPQPRPQKPGLGNQLDDIYSTSSSYCSPPFNPEHCCTLSIPIMAMRGKALPLREPVFCYSWSWSGHGEFQCCSFFKWSLTWYKASLIAFCCIWNEPMMN